MSSAGPSQKSKSKNKSKYRQGGKRNAGPPRGGDGQGAFTSGPFAKYKTQPLPDMMSIPGISITTVQGKERIAEREILEALEEAADVLYPDIKMDDDEAAGGSGGDDDIEDMLKKELATLSGSGGEAGKKSPRFRLCKRETACVVYIAVLDPLDPIKLVTHILEKCETTKKCSFRFVQRLTPITQAGNGTLTTLADLARIVLPAGFQTEDNRGLTFAIQTHSRNSGKIERLDMIKTVAEEVQKLNPAHKVDLSNAERTIIIDLFKTVVGISVVQDFDRYKKFNPSRVAKDAAGETGEDAAGGDGATKEQPAAENRTGEHAKSIGAAKAANRERRAAGIAEADAAKEAAKAAKATVPAKRQADDEALEEGEMVKTAADVESGEVVEDDKVELGDDFVEVIEDGRVTKVRRVE